MPKTPQEIADLDAHVGALIKKYGVRRCLLYRNDKIVEEVWFTFVDDIGPHKYASTSSYNDAFDGRLLNRPQDFGEKDWGDRIKLRTDRAFKPYALEHENEPPVHEWCGYEGY